MRPVLAAAALCAGLSLTSFAPPPSVAADALDPSRLAASLCGAKNSGAALMQELLVASAAAAPASADASMPLFGDLTHARFPLTTPSRKARAYFSQGLLLTYGFNHAGAVRSFREAQRLDADCALCWWGEANALGPNINAPMNERDRAPALQAIARAVALKDKASAMERALIEAQALRFSDDPKADRAALDAAYADAMLAVARQYPQDNDVAVLAAEAAMDTTPWNYWQADKRTPIGPRIAEAIGVMEGVLKRDPSNLQAAHLSIHLLEASDPSRAEAAADRLRNAAPANAGHLVHMPSHIYYTRGRFAESIRANIAAVRSDEAFIRRTGDKSIVRYGYYPHNVHFIVTSAQMAGDMKTAITEAQRLRTLLDVDTSASIGWIQAIDASPYLAMAQFAEPQAILALPEPDLRLPYAVGMRHYARAVAYAQRKDRDAFERELGAIQTLLNSTALSSLTAQGMPAGDLLTLAQAAARGRFAMLDGRYKDAIAQFRTAVAIESRIPYQEPPFWYYPARQSLGAALYLDGRYAEASQAFRDALVQSPNNAWALYGLARSEAAQAHYEEAAATNAAFARAWLGDRTWLRMERL